MKGAEIFMLHDTHGVPLSYILDEFDKEEVGFNWFDWVKQAVAHGWSYDKVKATIHTENDARFGTKWHHLKHLIPVMYILASTESYEKNDT